MATGLARSYVKVYGPPVLKAIRALEKLAVDFSKTTAIRHYSVLTPLFPITGSGETYSTDVSGGERMLLPEISLPVEEKVKLISRAGDTLGEHDFFFEWTGEPTKKEVQELIAKIDEALGDCGCRYTIVTR